MPAVASDIPPKQGEIVRVRSRRYLVEGVPGREFAADLSAKWPASTRPLLDYYPRSLQMDAADRANWHAKSVVVDDAVALVTSANFTEWAHQRNVEAGVLVRNVQFARQLRQQFEGLVQTRAVLEVPGFRN